MDMSKKTADGDAACSDGNESKLTSVKQDAETEKSTAKEDYAAFHKTCEQLMNLFKQYSSCKSGDGRVEKLKTEIVLALIKLRRYNRIAQFRNKIARDKLSVERQAVDEQYLKLQNLLYEVSHVEKEAARCLEFKPEADDIDLVPTEQFYAEAPVSISKPEVTRSNIYELQLARLIWELTTRKNLSEQLSKLTEEKSVLDKEILERERMVTSLRPKLQSIIEASKPVQELLNLNYEHTFFQSEHAKFLPKPLFYVYVLLLSYNDLYAEESVGVSVDGDFVLARQAASSRTKQTDVDLITGRERRSNTFSSSTDLNDGRHSDSAVSEQMVDNVLSMHPLFVKDDKLLLDRAVATLHLLYSATLDIIFVKSFVQLSSNVASPLSLASDVFAEETLLAFLFPNDSGQCCPNLISSLKLRHLQGKFATESSQAGKAYMWAQRLATLACADCSSSGSASVAISSETPISNLAVDSCSFLRSVLDLIKRRLTTRLILQETIAKFENLNIDLPKPAYSLFSSQLTARLTSWTSMTYEDFIDHPATQAFLKAETISREGWFFCAFVEREKAKLSALIYIDVAYPVVAPVFCLLCCCKGTHLSSDDEQLRALERYICRGCIHEVSEEMRDYILPIQLQLLISRFEVLLEAGYSDSYEEGNAVACHSFERKRRGRDQEFPVVYSPNQNYFIFQ